MSNVAASHSPAVFPLLQPLPAHPNQYAWHGVAPSVAAVYEVRFGEQEPQSAD